MSDLLSSMDDQIAKAKEQALSRKDILDKVEKWKVASGEENWLDEYETVNHCIGYGLVCCSMHVHRWFVLIRLWDGGNNYFHLNFSG